jgi:hypothetical protein
MEMRRILFLLGSNQTVLNIVVSPSEIYPAQLVTQQLQEIIPFYGILRFIISSQNRIQWKDSYCYIGFELVTAVNMQIYIFCL